MSSRFKTLAQSFFAIVLFVNAVAAQSQSPSKKLDASSRDKQRLERFDKQADELRTRLKIPGLSAVVIRDQRVLWAKGFGFADREKRIPATPDTLYSIASLTKTFAATLVMQLVEQNKLDLNEPVSRYSSDFKDDSVKIKHLISHTSDGTPGERYQYDGNRFDYLTAVIEKKTGKPFGKVMVETFLDPLGMSSSVPGHSVVDEKEKSITLLGKENLDRYTNNLSRFSQPYTLYGDNEIVDVAYPPKGMGAAAGLISTVQDMAKFDAAIDRHLFLKKETQEEAWTAFVSNSGQRLPHGLGWFVSDYKGLRLIWHYGHWGVGFSSIYVKVPEKNLSLIMLSNSEALSDHLFQVGEDITGNVFACTFLRLFVFDDAPGSRSSKQSNASDCERDSETAVAKWIENRRKQARAQIQLDPKILETYAGTYQFDESPHTLTVTREGGRLFVNWPRNFKSELFAEAESKFFLKVRRFQIIFIKGEGQVTHMEFVSMEGTETVRLKRVK